LLLRLLSRQAGLFQIEDLLSRGFQASGQMAGNASIRLVAQRKRLMSAIVAMVVAAVVVTAASCVKAPASRCISVAGVLFGSTPWNPASQFDGRRHAVTARRALSWQARLDKALLSVDAPPSARIRNLRRILEDPSAVLKDLNRVATVLSIRGIKDGHPEAINVLFPKGTTARSDLEGLQALRKQVPEVIQDLRTIRPEDIQTRNNQQQISLGELAQGLVSLVVDDKKQAEFIEEAKNSLRSKPRGLEGPEYKVLRVLSNGSSGIGRVELRQYKPFTIAKRGMPGVNTSNFASGQGFMSLASYLFGNNSDAVAMQMTSPVEISFGAGEDANMSFVLPKAFSSSPPEPQVGEDIQIARIQDRLVVAKRFTGIVTEGEVQRQRDELEQVLDVEDLQQVNSEEYSILQYNAPFTVPWRRVNELIVAVQGEACD